MPDVPVPATRPQSSNTVLYFFHQRGCVHCAQMQPIVDELTRQYFGRILILDLDVDHHDRIDDVKIKATPTFAVKHNGFLTQVRQGMMTKAQLERMIEGKNVPEPQSPRRRRRPKRVDEPEGPDDGRDEQDEPPEAV